MNAHDVRKLRPCAWCNRLVQTYTIVGGGRLACIQCLGEQGGLAAINALPIDKRARITVEDMLVLNATLGPGLTLVPRPALAEENGK